MFTRPSEKNRLDPRRCLACQVEGLTFVEEVPIMRLAEAWATDREVRGCRRPSANALQDSESWQAKRAAWFDAITRALKTDVVRFDRCRHCGLEMSWPLQPWPEGLYPEDEDYPVRWEFTRCLDDLGPSPLRLLELGCGAGEFLALARQRGHTAIGIDFNPRAVETAKARGLEAVYGGFEQLREHLANHGLSNSFDAVAVFHVIEHLSDPHELFRLLSEFVKPGGRIAISCPGPRRFTRLIREQQVGTRDLWDYPPHHVLRWTIAALRCFLEGIDWEVLRACEEPLPYVGASAQMGCTRAMWKGYLHCAWKRRLSIAWARVRLLPALFTMTGLSLYVMARRCPAPPERR